MRIAMVSEHASPLAVLGGVDAGGQNVHVAALAEHLGRRGHVVEVFTRRDSRRPAERVPLCDNVTVVHVPAGPPRQVPKDELLPHMPAFARWLVRYWTSRGTPDVVHGHFWMSGLAALQAGRDCGVPVAQTFHALGTVKRRYQGSADTSPPERIDLERRVATEVDLVLATCSDEVAELEAMGVPTGHVQVVPCGVDTAHFRPGPAPQTARPRLLSVGRLVERKGFEVAVRAMPLLPEAELVIAGGPPAARLGDDAEARRLLALADAVGVADRVTLVGQVDHDDMPALLRSARVVVATPWYEPFGIMPLEAAACGRPVVGSAVGGLLDTVEDGVTGRLVPPRDPAALAVAVQELLDDPDLARRWGEAARRRAVARYDWAQVAQETETALTAVARSAAGAPAARTDVEAV
ncbi:MAG: glycosyltransferase [Actinomycetes bacterium]